MMNNIRENIKFNSKVAVYIRVGKEDKDEVKKQKILFKEYIDKEFQNNLKKIKYYVDNGYSGNDINRKQLNKLIEDYKNGNIDYIYTKDISRIARDFEILKEVQNRGLDINNINYIDKAKSKFTINLYSVIEEYKKIDLKKIIQSQRKNRVNRTSKKIFSSRER